MTSLMIRAAAALAVGLLVLAPKTARASNMTHPRTPVLWEDVPCITLHDRSQDPTLHLPYAIPFEDTEVKPDEVAGSRTHQFIAFCRPHDPQNFLPTWISQADVDDAVAVGLIRPGVVEPEAILESSTVWQDCWFRINGDDERRAITTANAEAGVDWDITDLPAGGYTIDGYTYEPVFNVWWLRPGVVKIHDGDPAAVGPVGAISTGELTPYRNDTEVLEGCVDTLPGSTFSVSYALVSPDPPQWIGYLPDQPIDGDAFAFDFTPPMELWGQSGMIRVDFVDPMGRAYTTYQADNILVINEDNPATCEDGGSFIGNPCAESSGGMDESSGGQGPTTSAAEDATAGEDAEGSTGPMQTGGDAGPAAKSCACSAAGGAHASALALFVLSLARRRRDARS